jgi:hypothetical protein
MGSVVFFTPASVAQRYPRPGIAYRPVSDLLDSTLALAWARARRPSPPSCAPPARSQQPRTRKQNPPCKARPPELAISGGLDAVLSCLDRENSLNAQVTRVTLISPAFKERSWTRQTRNVSSTRSKKS